MSRVLVGFVRNVNFLLERGVLTARIPMPVDGTWRIAEARQERGDLLVTFAPHHNPLVEAEAPVRHNAPAEAKCRFEAQSAQ